MDILRNWYAQKREKYKTNLSGIESGENLPEGSVQAFVKKGYVSKESYPAMLQYALENGFKYQPNQKDFAINGDVCEIFFLEEGEAGEFSWSSQAFFISDSWKEYDQEHNPKKREKADLPTAKKRVVKVKAQK
jgi:hypothetical protein